MAKPSFFIVGAPKCGTTALYQYLKGHPDVFLPQKELYFFGKDFQFRQPRMEETYYQSLYKSAKPNQFCGDASVWYLFSETAAKEIKKFNKEAKIIIMLRQPAEMLYSLHSQQLFAGNETIEDFELALNSEKSRREGKNIPPLIGCPIQALNYSEVAKFGEQLNRYFEVFNPNQIKIIFQEEFAENPAKIFNEVLQFLGIELNFKTSLKKVNTNKEVRFPLLRDLLKERSPNLIKWAKILIPSKSIRQKVQDILWDMNAKKVDRKPLSKDLKKKLTQDHLDDIKLIEKITKRDLAAWYS